MSMADVSMAAPVPAPEQQEAVPPPAEAAEVPLAAQQQEEVQPLAEQQEPAPAAAAQEAQPPAQDVQQPAAAPATAAQLAAAPAAVEAPAGETRQLRDPSLQPISGTIGHRRGRGGPGGPAPLDVEPSRPKRTVRRPARRFDDDFEAPEPDSDEVGDAAAAPACGSTCCWAAGSAGMNWPDLAAVWSCASWVVQRSCCAGLPTGSLAALLLFVPLLGLPTCYRIFRLHPSQDYVPSDRDDPPSPQRPSAAHRARAAAAAALSPATQAAVTMASLLGGRGDGGLPPVLPAVVGRPRVKSGAGDDDPNDPDATIEGLMARPTHRRSTPGGRGARATAFAAAAGLHQLCGLRSAAG